MDERECGCRRDVRGDEGLPGMPDEHHRPGGVDVRSVQGALRREVRRGMRAAGLAGGGEKK